MESPDCIMCEAQTHCTTLYRYTPTCGGGGDAAAPVDETGAGAADATVRGGDPADPPLCDRLSRSCAASPSAASAACLAGSDCVSCIPRPA